MNKEIQEICPQSYRIAKVKICATCKRGLFGKIGDNPLCLLHGFAINVCGACDNYSPDMEQIKYKLNKRTEQREIFKRLHHYRRGGTACCICVFYDNEGLQCMRDGAEKMEVNPAYTCDMFKEK